MDQFRQIGEVLGSLKAVMVLKHDIQINQRQCSLLYDMYVLAFETISEEIRQNLRLDERNIKWKALEYPMKELHRIFKEGEQYIRYCLDIKDWWGKAISLHFNRDSVDYHIHNLLCCFPVVIEAIETAAEISVLDQDDMQKRRSAILKKYDPDLNDPKLFQWMYGNQYLIPRDICSRIDNAFKEDKWLLIHAISEKKGTFSSSLTKHQKRIGDFLIKKMNEVEGGELKLLPSSVLVGANDYAVKRRLGLGKGHVKEIQWLGETFALRTFFGEIEPAVSHDISQVLSLSHPNILQYFCGFYDEEMKEGFLLMEAMNKNLNSHIKENCGQRKSFPFSLPAAVDIMLQIARGMEYIHSRKIYHGDLNPSNILLKARSSSTEGYFHAKISGFSLSSIKVSVRSPATKGDESVIWYAPEVLAELERQTDQKCSSKYSEKADIYSFGMLCFEILTGKVPFEDSHLQGNKIIRNIRAGERPLFPYPSPKYLANLTRRCWHPTPSFRPSFSSLCRILRYIKKILIINPDHGHPDLPPPLVDYCDIEAGYSKKFPGEGSLDLPPVSLVPFQLYSYKVIEKEKISQNSKDKGWDLLFGETLPRTATSLCGEERLAAIDDLFLLPSDARSVHSEIIETKNPGVALDQRSVVSENANFKLFSSDQRSIGSESPGRKFLLSTKVDQRSSSVPATPGRKAPLAIAVDPFSLRPTTAEGKVPQLLTPTSQKSNVSDNSEQEILSESDHKTADSKTSDTKTMLTTVNEHKVNRSETSEKEQLSVTSADNGLLSSSGTSEKKAHGRKIVHRRKLSEIPEKTIPASLSKQKPVSENAERKIEPITSTSKAANSKSSNKKTSLSKKLIGAIAANVSGSFHSLI